MTHYLAIDFGGTRLRAALFNSSLRMIKRAETLTKVHEGQDAVLQRLISIGKSVINPDIELASIGLAAPGPLNARSGVILKAGTLPGWSNVSIRKIVSDAFDHVPTYVQNDGNLGALAEYHLGAGKGTSTMIYLTISTGIGGGAIIDGRLFTGAKSLAIEPGHMLLSLPDGSHRRLEELASGTALGYWARDHLRTSDSVSTLRNQSLVDGKTVGEAAIAGDPLAISVVTEAGQWLGLGLTNLLHLFNPDAIVVGGSVMNLGDMILEPARVMIRQNILHEDFFDENIIRPAAIKEDMCLVGAALNSKLNLTK